MDYVRKSNPIVTNIGKPFVKWLGGKKTLLPTIESKLPYDFDRVSTYVEPFVGGGSVFFLFKAKIPSKTIHTK